jgi:hypothetical protein
MKLYKGKVPQAERIEVYVCDHCGFVHLAMYRHTKIIAGAVIDPNDADGLCADIRAAAAEVRTRTRH